VPVSVNDRGVAGHLYRIAQEAVNNAMKHSRAKHVTVRLVRAVDTLSLEISDDGGGFAKDRTGQPGVGLGVMKHRAGVIGAELTINSEQDAGVTIRCRLPAEKMSTAIS
jgi:signal transduction histidine kinase